MAGRFLRLGADVQICGQHKSACDETATELMAAHGRKVTSHGVDIRDAAAVDMSRTQDISPRGSGAVAKIVMHGTFW